MHQVRIEFFRVQTFLFAVPKLREMVGANALLGETVRNKLCILAQSIPSSSVNANVYPEQLDANSDPLSASSIPDNPRSLATSGILTRDGGHFSALFNKRNQALQFQDKAEALLRSELPGLPFEINLIEIGKKCDKSASIKYARGLTLADLPIFEVCRASGNGPAAEINAGDEVSSTVLIRRKKGDQFTKGQTEDTIGLLHSCLPLSDKRHPEDFNRLCMQDLDHGSDYMAVIHADGNNVGRRFTRFFGKTQDANTIDAFLVQEGHGETFFHSMRCAVRKAVIKALSEAFKDYSGEYQPYQLLMLGGDDLLMVCRARYALPFVVAYAEALREIELSDGQPLSIGAGIAISRPSVPFHRLHTLAEELAGSAKRLYRNCVASHPDDAPSVADWIVFSESWSDDPIAVRRRHDRVQYGLLQGQTETLALSCKPYRVLGNGSGSLQEFLSAADKLNMGAARSQLRQLGLELSKGRQWAELCWNEMEEKTHETLKAAGLTELWSKSDACDCSWSTHVADLIEVYEVSRRPDAKKQMRGSGNMDGGNE